MKKRMDIGTLLIISPRQSQILLGLSLLFIMCWMIGAIWLIRVRHDERSLADLSEHQGSIALNLSLENKSSY